MTRRSLFPRPVMGARRAGFTLIELLTVIAIILVLAGLLINVASSASYKSSFARAQSEIKAMETALESYKADNGAYPRILPSTMTQSGTAFTGGSSTSDTLNAQSDTDPGSNGAKAKYQGGSETLYQTLSGITGFSGGNPVYGGKRYMDFKPGQLADSAGTAFTAAATTTMVVDPFGQPYGYSTINAATLEQGQDATAKGYNPTFDLWSSAGYGTGGKTYPTGVTAANYYTLWAKNW